LFNKLHLPGTLWIAADIHLSAQVPATCQAFVQFLAQAATQADALLLCGDIFDAWIGDDQLSPAPVPWLVPVVQALQHAAARIPVWLGRGNRDFLLGAAFARAVGGHLLPDVALLQTDAGEVLLTHGDQYCTDDRAYQRLRRIVRNPMVQRLYLALALQTRQAIAAWLRARSQASNQQKSSVIMDVNAQAVAQAFRQSRVTQMIHGHTHRPGSHVTHVDGCACYRYVLSDWELDTPGVQRLGWLQLSADGIRPLP